MRGVERPLEQSILAGISRVACKAYIIIPRVASAVCFDQSPAEGLGRGTACGESALQHGTGIVVAVKILIATPGGGRRIICGLPVLGVELVERIPIEMV